MFGKNLSNEQIRKVKDTLNNLLVVNALENGQYDIFYSFDNVLETITYEAILKENVNLPEYISFKLLPNGSFLTDPTYTETSCYLDHKKQFYYFIISNDKLLNDSINVLINRYSPIKEKIKPLIYLSPNHLESRFQSRNDFNTLIKELANTKDIKKEESDIRLEVYINTFQNPWKLSLKIGKEKMYNISSISQFLELINKEEFYSYGKELSFTHRLSSFNEASQLLITFLSKVFVYSSYKDQSMNLFPSTALKLFHTYNDQIIIINNENYYIDPKINIVDVEIKSDNIKIHPIFKGEYYHEHKKGFIINQEENIINLLTFEDSISEKLYSFSISNPSFNWNHVQDIIQEKLTPLIANIQKEENNYINTTENGSLEIRLFLDLTNEDKLIFTTKYFINNTEQNKEEILQELIFRKKIYAYEDELKNLNFKENDVIDDPLKIVEILKSDFSNIKKTANVLLSDSLSKKKITKLKKIKISTKYDLDWLNLSIDSEDYSQEEINNIILAYNKKKKFYQLNDDIILIDNEPILALLSQLNEEFDFDLKNKNNRPIPLYQLFNLQEYHSLFESEYDNTIKKIISDISNYKKNEYPLNSYIKSSMRPYQIFAFKWMKTLRKYNLSGVLADDMGLGKTLETISFISTLEEKLPIIIISPKSLLFNWEAEFKKWNPNEKVYIINGTKQERQKQINSILINQKNIYITSYDSLRNDIELYDNIYFSLVILDEAQYIKNAYALKTRAVKELKAISRLVLTGTPIENSLTDLWSIFDFLMPNYLGGFNNFKQTFEKIIVNENDKNTKKLLNAKIKPFILRRTKNEVLKELPNKTETIQKIDLSPEQRELYDAYLQKAKISLKDKKQTKIDILALLTRLRQICIEPNMFVDNFNFPSEKIETVISLIESAIANGHKIILFSSFTQALEKLKEKLFKENIDSYYIHGGVDAKKRLSIANNFNDSNDVKVILVSLKAGGTGLNLIGGDIVIHLDPWWNLAAENQATDRAYRIGQTKPVQVIKLICRNTIEEKVLFLQEIKKTLSDDIINHEKSSNITISEEDLEYLLS